MGLVSALFACLSASLCLSTNAQQLKVSGSLPVVVAFGDSLTDQGRSFALSGNKFPLAKNGYFKGRFTNAPGTWMDHVAKGTPGIQTLNFAVGGASACPAPAAAVKAFPVLGRIPYLAQQIAQYRAKVASDASLKAKTRIPIIWIGGNDLLMASYLPTYQVFQLPKNISDCIMAGANTLLQDGHKTIVIAVLPPVDLAPAALLSNATQIAQLAVSAANANIKAGAAALQVKYPDRKVLFWDMAELREIVANPVKYGFKYGPPRSCVSGGASYSAFQGNQPTSVCKDSNAYVFFDPTHPSSKSHGVVLSSLVTLLRKNKAFWKP